MSEIKALFSVIIIHRTVKQRVTMDVQTEWETVQGQQMSNAKRVPY